MDHQSSMYDLFKGPTFHRWLPDGEKDAITFHVENDNVTVLLWFERRGSHNEMGFFKYDAHKQEAKPEFIARQGVLDAGLLFGKIIISDINDEQIDAVEKEQSDSTPYLELSKRVVKKILDPSISQLCQVLRYVFGQYWIAEHQSFDSRHSSIMYHCSIHQIKWLSGTQWKEFRPSKDNIVSLTMQVSAGDFSEYIQERDWKTIGELVNQKHTPPLASVVSMRALEFLDGGKTAEAIVHSVTALEIAINSFISNRSSIDKRIEDSVQSFCQYPLPVRLTLVGLLGLNVPPDRLIDVLDCIEQRNALVHEGIIPNEKASKQIESTLSIIKQMVPNPSFRSPHPSEGNILFTKSEDSRRS
jgi:hypothetical protein